ncbi:MAG: YfhO family protein [Lachnospiraceae bacterium]|nr:YfhO family protein [Lachnospiraceae bacterium]
MALQKKGGELWKTAGWILLPGFIALFLFLSVMVLKGIMPFGPNRLDYYDMGQQNVPLYHHIWDILHGRSSAVYSWYVNLGQNMVMASTTQWNLSLLNLFLLLIPRDVIYPAMTFILGLKLFFMSVHMCLFLREAVPADHSLRTAFSTAYGLCGYTLTHSTVPENLDMAVYFPLLMLFLYRMLSGRKTRHISSTGAYALCLGYLLVLSYYTGCINLIFVLLSSGAYLLLLCEKEKQGATASRLGLGTMGGFALASFWLLPAVRQMSNSARLSDNQAMGLMETVKMILRAIGTDQYYIKGWQLSGAVAAMAVILSGLWIYRKEKRQTLFIMLFCFFPCAMIPFESIDLIWHAGTYTQYPIRCGYIIAFVLLSSAAYYAGRIKEDATERTPAGLLAALGLAAALALIGLLTIYRLHDVWPVELLFRAWILFATVLFLLSLFLCGIRRRIPCLMILMALELCTASYIGFGDPHFSDRFFEEPQQKTAYIPTVNAIRKGLPIPKDRLDRIKNPDTSMNVDYSWLVERASVSGWCHTATAGQLSALRGFGGNTDFLRMLDSGGTLFSDALFHVTQTVTCEPFYCENESYRRSAMSDGYGLYDHVYRLPFAMAVSPELSAAEIGDKDPADVHNLFFQAMTGTDSLIMERMEGMQGMASGKKALYLFGGKADCIRVNGKPVPVPTIGDMDNTAYPANFNHGLVFAGIFQDEEIGIEGLEKGKAYLLDLNALERLCEKYQGMEQRVKEGNRSLSFTVEGDPERNLAMIPVCYNPGFKVMVNGEKKEAVNVAELFTGIPIGEGENRVEISFLPEGMQTGALISLLSVLILFFCEWRKAGHALLDRIAGPLLKAVWGMSVLLIYVIPIIAFIIHEIVKHIP